MSRAVPMCYNSIRDKMVEVRQEYCRAHHLTGNYSHGTPSHKLCLSTLPVLALCGSTANQLMRKWPGLSETAVHVHHNVWWDLSGNPAKGPRTSLWRHFSVVMTPMQASSGWGISVCGHLNSSVTCGPVVPSQVVCSAVFLPYLNHWFR